MKNFAITGAVAALLGMTEAVKVKPDVYGPEGENYENHSANYELSRIGIDITTKGQKELCKAGDWTTVHYQARLKDGRIVSDTKMEPGNMPKTFALGAHETFKCLDNAITQLHQGDKATLKCPSYQAWGDAYTQAPLGGEPIPLGSDIDFDIEIVECNRTPEFTKQTTQPVTTTMQPGKCMYLHFEEADHTGYELVLSCQDEDWGSWWPAKYCFLEHKVVDDESQQWYWNEKTGTLHNAANPKYTLDNDMGWLMIAKTGSKAAGLSKNFPTTPRKWFFDSVEHTLTTDIDGVKSDVAIWGNPKKWTYAQVAPHAKLGAGANNMFRVEYCFRTTG